MAKFIRDAYSLNFIKNIFKEFTEEEKSVNLSHLSSSLHAEIIEDKAQIRLLRIMAGPFFYYNSIAMKEIKFIHIYEEHTSRHKTPFAIVMAYEGTYSILFYDDKEEWKDLQESIMNLNPYTEVKEIQKIINSYNNINDKENGTDWLKRCAKIYADKL